MILAINPGSTSTKIGVFKNEQKIFEEIIRHDVEILNHFETTFDQLEFRTNAIKESLNKHGIDISNLIAIACRGGLTPRVEGGTYLVTSELCEYLKDTPHQHPSNLAAVIGKSIADFCEINAYFVDGIMTYEIDEICSYSGHKELMLRSGCHALNQKAVARDYAKAQQMRYEDINIIVAHMGGGITVGAHKNGRIIDVNDGIDEGPFTPERTGSLPVRQLVDLCFSQKYTHEEMKKFIQGQGGLVSYLGHSDVKRAVEESETDPYVKKVLDAMILQIAGEIGKRAVTLNGDVKAIILTGGLAYSEYITSEISKRVQFIASTVIYPGEKELEALVAGVNRILNEEDEVRIVKF